MKKAKIVLMTIAALFALTGCQNNKKQNAVKKQSGTAVVRQNNNHNDSNSDSDSSNDSDQDNSENWDSAKQDKLDTFFTAWSKTMKQDYEKYDGNGQIQTAAGEEFPKDFDKVEVDGQKATLAYKASGEGNAAYNVIAIYNYDKGEATSHITYFFAFHDDQPIVLVDETTNGNYVQAKETANQDLINGFKDIAAGKNAIMTSSGEATSSNSSSNANDNDSENTSAEDPKLIGTFIGLLKAGDWFKDNVKSGHMYIGKDDTSAKLKDYYCITTNGDPTSYFWFKQDGDQIIVKYVKPKKGQSVAEAGLTTETYAISRLKNDYYVNSGQKQEVNGYVDELKPLSEANK